ncbi:phage holin family protein [Salinactinospora qingdaonensis]|uniref:Phage holin family protein n=1 Tax=Salinactinospora qingdaonensis TaxID=702744 RepID=A0ABP7FBI6_9ACTN
MLGIPEQQRAEAAETSTAEASTADLVKQASEQISHLVREELRLAQLEMRQKGKRAGSGIGMFGVAAVVALSGVGALVAGLVLLLALVLPAWGAALIVAGALLVIAGVLASIGGQQLKRATPLKPEETLNSVQADMTAIRERAR